MNRSWGICTYLEQQKSAYQKAGHLEAMLAVEAEMKAFETEAAKELSPFAELNRLQAIYREQREGLAKKSASVKLELIRGFRQNAADLAKNWTKEGRIEDAKLALAEAKRFEEMEKDPSLAVVTEPPVVPNPPKTGASFEGRKAGEEMENGLGMKFCWVPAGKFTMGSPEGEKGRDDSKEAQVKVELTDGFWMSKFEVTQGEYEEIVGANPSNFKESGKRAPVERVNWDEAMAFCEKLSETGRKKGALPKGWCYTLPTEAQWEYACRAGSAGPYSGELDEMGWRSGNRGGKTHEVGKKKANAWGLHDMHGNAREWCRDWLEPILEGGTDPEGPKEGAFRVFRGGSYGSTAATCRSAFRNANQPSFRGSYLGLRPALVPSEPADRP